MKLDDRLHSNRSFANPKVDDEIIYAILRYLDLNGESHPVNIINHVKKKKDVPRSTVRKGIRKLKMSNVIVPSEPFIGELEVGIDDIDI